VWASLEGARRGIVTARLGTAAGLAAAVLAGLLVVTGTGAEAELRLDREDYPVVDGSTSTQPLGVLVAGRVTRTSVEWHRRSVFDSTRLLALTGAPYDPAKRLPLEMAPPSATGPDLVTVLSPTGRLAERIVHSGTNQSYGRLAAGQAELVLAAREPTPAEREAVRRAGASIVARPIARDAFVFLRHASNPVTSLTLDQIRDIYAGTLTGWKALGGGDRPIVAYQRDATSGSQVEMEQLVMRGRRMREGPDITVTMAMTGPSVTTPPASATPTTTTSDSWSPCPRWPRWPSTACPPSRRRSPPAAIPS
jgi:ABC-type phosphate transport system substrate-binding protein